MALELNEIFRLYRAALFVFGRALLPEFKKSYPGSEFGASEALHEHQKIQSMTADG